MTDAPRREQVNGYLRRFRGWTRLCAAFAGELGVSPADVLDLAVAGRPVVFLEARTQHGDFAIEFSAYIDLARVTAYPGKAALLAGVARALGEEILYDDGTSHNPYRWVLVRPDGRRYEVFEDAAAASHALVLDRGVPPRELPEDGAASTARRIAALERQLERGRTDFHVALDRAQDPGADGFANFAAWERRLTDEIARLKGSAGARKPEADEPPP